MYLVWMISGDMSMTPLRQSELEKMIRAYFKEFSNEFFDPMIINNKNVEVVTIVVKKYPHNYISLDN